MYNTGCRCDGCKEANRSRNEKARRDAGVKPKVPATHGSHGMYAKGCRCGICTESKNAYNREYYKKSTHDQYWTHYLKSNYGITPEQWHEMSEAQGHVCAICGKIDKVRRLSVDHDHVTGKVRGLLCGGCNKSIGHLGDSVEGLMRAVKYIESST